MPLQSNTAKLNILIIVNSDSFEYFNSLFTATRYFYEDPLVNKVALLDLQHNPTFFSDFDDFGTQVKVIHPDAHYSFETFKNYDVYDADVTEFDGVLMRMNVTTGYDLKALSQKLKNIFSVPFINDLDGMLEFGSKGKLAEMQNTLTDDGVCYIPETRNCATAKEVHDFRRTVDEDIVIKSFYGYGGKEVFLMLHDGFGDFADDMELDAFIQNVGGEVCVQKFIKTDRVIDDRVILLFDPETQTMKAPCIMRRSAPEGMWRANVTQGATMTFCGVDERHVKIANLLGAELIRAGIYLAGVDVLYDQENVDAQGRALPKITEVNVRNVGGLINISEWAGIDYTRQFTDGVCYLFRNKKPAIF